LLIISTKLTSESVCSNIVEWLSLLLESNSLEQSFWLIHLGGQQLIIIVLSHLLFLFWDISVLLNFSVDILNLFHPLINGRVKLHGVLCCMLQCLLQISNLSWEFSLRSYKENKSIKICNLHLSYAFFFSTFGRYFSWIVSLLKTERSMSLIISSCFLRSYSYLSSILWISFFIATISVWPIVGSRASYISFSSWIFLSQRRICLSASTISAKISAFCSLRSEIWFSSLILSFSSSLSFYLNSFSILKLSFFNFCCRSVFL